MNRQALDDLKQQIPLLGYLQAQDGHPSRPLSRGRWMGLCPLHRDRKPSFLVDPHHNLFFTATAVADMIRFAELYHQVKFQQALALLRQRRGVAPLVAGSGLKVESPEKLAFLFEPHRYKILYGGRGGIKSWTIAQHLLIAGRRWHRRSSISPKATAGAWILIWRNFSIESITTN